MFARTAPPLTSTAAQAAGRSAAACAARFATPRTLAVGRTGVGATLLLRPRLIPQLLGIDSATATRTGFTSQMLGAREIALGVGGLLGRESRLWTAAGLFADATDAAVMAVAVARGRVKASTGLVSVTVAVTACAVALDALRGQDASD